MLLASLFLLFLPSPCVCYGWLLLIFCLFVADCFVVSPRTLQLKRPSFSDLWIPVWVAPRLQYKGVVCFWVEMVRQKKIAGRCFREYGINGYPNNPCMLYLPTFTIIYRKIQRSVGKYSTQGWHGLCIT